MTDKPSFIVLRTIIGWPAPNKQNTGGRARLRARRRRGRRDQGDPRLRPGGDLPGRGGGADPRARGRRARQGPARRVGRAVRAWGKQDPERAALFARMADLRAARGLGDALPEFPADPKGIATRKASGEVLTALAPVLPELWGGSADLAESNLTTMEGEPSFLPADRQTEMWPGNPYGRTLHFGIREHGMGAILNGIAAARRHPRLRRHVPAVQRLHARRRAAGGADGAAGHLRLDARLDRPRRGRPDPPAGRAPVVAAEHPAACDVVRPADANETAVAWQTILENTDRPGRPRACPGRTCRRSTGRSSRPAERHGRAALRDGRRRPT